MIGPVPTLAIVAFAERHDAVSSSVIMLHLGIAESRTLSALAHARGRGHQTSPRSTRNGAGFRTRPHTQRARRRARARGRRRNATGARPRHDRGTLAGSQRAHTVPTATRGTAITNDAIA